MYMHEDLLKRTRRRRISHRTSIMRVGASNDDAIFGPVRVIALERACFLFAFASPPATLFEFLHCASFTMVGLANGFA
jgi:hypothetical protein